MHNEDHAWASAQFIRRQATDWSQADEQALQQWLSAQPHRPALWRHLEQTWAAFDAVPRPVLFPVERTVIPWYRCSMPVMIACALVCLLLLGGWWGSGWLPQYQTRVDTAANEMETLALPDGSLVSVHAGTQLSVRYMRGRRLVELVHGQAYFEVAPDSGRPFVVLAGTSQVVVTGTAFDVRLDTGLRVQVSQGSVAVRVRAGQEDVALRRGQMLTLGSDGRLIRQTVVPEDIGIWRQGMVAFERTSLAQVVAELSRHADFPVRISRAELNSLQVSGYASDRNPRAFLLSLQDLLGVTVRSDGSGGLIIE